MTRSDIGHDTKPVRATTQPSAQRARGLGPSVPASWVRVCTLYTRLSFDSVHYTKSLFRSLFMNTVLEHCSRGFKKKQVKLNKIKYFFFVKYDLIYGIIVLHYL